MSAANSDRPLHEQFLLVRDECETWDGGPQVASYIEVIVRASGSEARARASPGAQLRGACSEANTYPHGQSSIRGRPYALCAIPLTLLIRAMLCE
jgi:hypothetical protein